MDILFLFLPAIASFIFSGIMASQPNKTMAQRLMVWTFLASAIYFISDALVYFRLTEPHVLCVAYVIYGFVVPALPISLILLLWSLHTRCEIMTSKVLSLLLIPFSFGFIQLTAYWTLGFDKAALFMEKGLPADLTEVEMFKYEFFTTVTQEWYVYVVGTSMIGCVVYMILLLYFSDFTVDTVMRFFFKGCPLRPVHLIIIVFTLFLATSGMRLGISRAYINTHQVLIMGEFAFQTLLLAVFCILGVHLKKPAIHISRAHAFPQFDDIPVDVRPSIEMAMDNGEMADMESKTYNTLQIRNEFKALMRDELCFRYPGMSRYSVADTLQVDRHTLDQFVYLSFNMTYDEYVKIQRVAFCTRYMRVFPKDKPTTVAMECGFASVRVMRKEIQQIQGSVLV